MASETPILEADALYLCQLIRQENHRRWFTPGNLMCWRCWIASGGDPAKMRLSSKPGFRGCSLINRRYDRIRQLATPATSQRNFPTRDAYK